MGPMLSAARNWVDRIHLNASAKSHRDGRPVMVKRRPIGSGMIMRFANVFFRLARNPVEALVRRTEWAKWEVDCFRRLHGPEFTAGVDLAGTAWIELLPGGSLSAQLAAGTLTPAMLAAAGAELRRAHCHECSYYEGAWSHGDPHSGNFLYDPGTNRARLIDFEVRHVRGMDEKDRHADDILVLLQDVCGRCAAEQWTSLAAGLIEGYGDASISSLIRHRLKVPGGIPRLWWAVRTTWMKRPELERRLEQLKRVLAEAEQMEAA